MNRITLTGKTEKVVTYYDGDGVPQWQKPLRYLEATDNRTTADIFEGATYHTYITDDKISAIDVCGNTGVITIYYASGFYLEIMSVTNKNRIPEAAIELFKEIAAGEAVGV